MKLRIQKVIPLINESFKEKKVNTGNFEGQNTA